MNPEIGTKPAEEIDVRIDTPRKQIRLLCEKHPDKCDKHHVKKGEMLKWRGKDRFTIYFTPGQSPFDKDVLIYEEATTAREALREGAFKYTVRDDADPGNELDPEIVVDPPKGDD